MVAEPRVWVDVEAAVREWARDSVASINRRVFFAYNTSGSSPQLVLFRISGPDDACVIQFDAWASNKSQAAQLAAELCTAADELSRYGHGGVLLHGASVVNGPRWQPDEESNAPRYVVDILFTATADE